MIEELKILAVIPARGGSKGVSRKNLRSVGGKSLLAHTLEAAKKSKYIDRTILSSDDEEIIAAAKALGCEVPFVRPKELSQDDTPGIRPLLHAAEMLPGYDLVVLLQLTSPLRTAADIDGAIEQMVRTKASALVSATEALKSPYWMVTLDSNGCMKPIVTTEKSILRRQDLPKAYVLNGAFFGGRPDFLKQAGTFLTSQTQVYLMPSERSYDLDSELDFKIVDFILRGEKS